MAGSVEDEKRAMSRWVGSGVLWRLLEIAVCT